MNKNKNVLVFCVEKGILEQQAVLLAESIKINLPSDFTAIAISPRSQFYLSPNIESLLVDCGVKVLKKDLNTSFEHYPIANKVISMQYVEENLQPESLIFIDTDTLFLSVPERQYLDDKNKLFLRPVDNKGPGSESKDDPNDEFWQDVFKLFEVELPGANIKTTVRPFLIRNYFNAGLIWANGLSGFYQQWFDDFMTIINSKLRPFGYQSRDGNDFRCLDQVALAVTATRFQQQLEILPETYNYPIPFRPIMKSRNQHPKFNDLIHVHYHKWFQHPGFLDHITNDEEKLTEQYKWLKEYLPLSPEIDGPFKC